MKLFFSRLIRKLKKIINKPKNLIGARKAYRFLLKNKADDEIIVIICSLIGDATIALTYMNDFIAHSDKKVTLLYHAAAERVVSKYDIKCKKIIHNNEGLYLYIGQIWQNNRLCEKGLKDGIICTNPWYFKKCVKAENNDAHYQLKHHILKNDNLKPQNPNISLDIKSVKSLPDFENNHDKVIVINPYSNSLLNQAGLSLFKDLIDYLNEHGYKLYTNVIKDQKPLAGTEPLNCPIDELYTICAHIPLFISVRSGIVDYVGSAGSNILVVFNACPQSFMEVYSLTNWEIPGKVKEIRYEGDSNINIEELLSPLL